MFQFTNDIVVVFQNKDLNVGEKVISDDLRKLNEFFTKWRLHAIPNKTEVCVFHLDIKQANKELTAHLEDTKLNHNFSSKYL